MNKTITKLRHPLHHLESMTLKHVLDELVDAGTDIGALELARPDGTVVAAVAILRGEDTAQRLEALGSGLPGGPVSADQLVDICSAFKAGFTAGGARACPWPQGTTEHAAWTLGKVQADQCEQHRKAQLCDAPDHADKWATRPLEC